MLVNESVTAITVAASGNVASVTEAVPSITYPLQDPTGATTSSLAVGKVGLAKVSSGSIGAALTVGTTTGTGLSYASTTGLTTVSGTLGAATLGAIALTLCAGAAVGLFSYSLTRALLEP